MGVVGGGQGLNTALAEDDLLQDVMRLAEGGSMQIGLMSG